MTQRDAIDVACGPDCVVHVYGDPEDGTMEDVCGHWCDEPADPRKPDHWTEVVFHREPTQLGLDYLCMLCGELTRQGDS